MSDEPKTEQPPVETGNHPDSKPGKENDSLGVPVEKSPWLVYALLQIPIVIIMVIVLYFMYQQRQQ